MDDDAQARTRALGDALQRGLAARVIASPEYAASPLVMGLDMLSSLMVNSPDTLPSFGPMLTLAVDLYNYAITGAESESSAAILRGEMPGF